ncbi:hypothetical protein MKK54_00450, partial [Methylobacterium sp. J-068]|nr:hypothetical protein [Methylobacterium sp. J-068]
RRLAQGALRLAAGDGLLTIEERRHQGRKNSPNLVRIISREWQAWIRRGGVQKRSGFALVDEGSSQPKALGCKALRPTDKRITLGTSFTPEPSKKLPERQSLAHR